MSSGTSSHCGGCCVPSLGLPVRRNNNNNNDNNKKKKKKKSNSNSKNNINSNDNDENDNSISDDNSYYSLNSCDKDTAIIAIIRIQL